MHPILATAIRRVSAVAILVTVAAAAHPSLASTEAAKPGGSAPQSKSPPTISGTAQEGQTLTADTGKWFGWPTSYGYQWLRCDSAGSSCASVSGATANTYPVGAGDVGSTMRVRVTATNSVGSTSALSDNTAVVSALPPEPSSTLEPSPTSLSWAPPTLTNPTTIDVADTQWYVSMDKTKDYIVKIGHHRPCAEAGSNRAGLWLEGGRNVVLIGGQVSIPCESTAYGRTGIKIRGATGTVHIEGVLIDNSGGYMTDGVAIAAPEATVQLQNMRIGPVWDSTSAHPDLVQVQAGVKELRIDALTGMTTFQGIFLYNEACEGCRTGSADLRRVNVHTLSGLGIYTASTVLWQTTKDIPVSVSEFYVDRQGTTRDIGHMAHPTMTYVWDNDLTRRAALAADGNSIDWPSSNITGSIRDGNPSSGDFVPSGVAGQNYLSPGYR